MCAGCAPNRRRHPYRLSLMASPQTRVEKMGHIGPNWFASVMGTGIVATAAATLPVNVPGLNVFARAVWVAAAVLLVGFALTRIVAAGEALIVGAAIFSLAVSTSYSARRSSNTRAAVSKIP